MVLLLLNSTEKKGPRLSASSARRFRAHRGGLPAPRGPCAWSELGVHTRSGTSRVLVPPCGFFSATSRPRLGKKKKKQGSEHLSSCSRKEYTRGAAPYVAEMISAAQELRLVQISQHMPLMRNHLASNKGFPAFAACFAQGFSPG